MVSQEALVHEQRVHRHAELVDLHLAALGVNGVGKGLVDSMALLVERILGIVGPDAGHDARSDERSDIIDVAVGLLGVDALLNPDDLLDTQVILEVLVHIGAKFLLPGAQTSCGTWARWTRDPLPPPEPQSRCGRGKQALVGHDHGAFAVDGNGAALEDHVIGTIATAAGKLSHLKGQSARPCPTGNRGRRRGRRRR